MTAVIETFCGQFIMGTSSEMKTELAPALELKASGLPDHLV